MRHDTGAALISVLVVVVVFFVVGYRSTPVDSGGSDPVQRQEKQLQAHYLARSGLEVALSYVFEQVARVLRLRT